MHITGTDNDLADMVGRWSAPLKIIYRFVDILELSPPSADNFFMSPTTDHFPKAQQAVPRICARWPYSEPHRKFVGELQHRNLNT